MRLNRREMLKVASAGLLSSGVFLGTRSVWGQANATNSYALHIGVDRIDPTVYPGTPNLNGCKNDVTKIKGVTESFARTKTLTDDGATFQQVARFVHWAAIDLQPGTTFLITYSGHGSQVASQLEPEEADLMDETWCLHDAQMRDDYRYWLFSHFRPGVKIVVISDSCRSGTTTRAVNSLARSSEDLKAPNSRIRGLLPPAAAARTLTPSGDSRSRARAAAGTNGQILHNAVRLRSLNETQQRAAEQVLNYSGVVARSPRGTFDLRNELGDFTGENAVRATGLLISACQDYEDAQESVQDPGGLFTKALVANVGVGNYKDLHASAVRALSGIQEPRWTPFGNTVADDVDEFYNGTPPFTG